MAKHTRLNDRLLRFKESLIRSNKILSRLTILIWPTLTLLILIPGCSENVPTPDPPIRGKLFKVEFMEYGPVLEFRYDGEKVDSIIYTDTYYKEVKHMKLIYTNGKLSRVTGMYGKDGIVTYSSNAVHIEVVDAAPDDGPLFYDYEYEGDRIISFKATDPYYAIHELLRWQMSYTGNNPDRYFGVLYDDLPGDTIDAAPTFDQGANPLYLPIEARMVLIAEECWNPMIFSMLCSENNVMRFLSDPYDIVFEHIYDSYSRPKASTVEINKVYKEMIRYTYK